MAGEPRLSLADVQRIVHTQAPLRSPILEWRGTVGAREWRLFNGPAKETLHLLPRDSIDCVVTSPPYLWLRDYKVPGQLGLEDSVDGYVAALDEVMSEVLRVLEPSGVLFLNLGDTYYSGKGESQGVDRKSSKRRFGLRAVDRSGGLGIGLQRKSIIGVPWRVAIKLRIHNWILRAPIIWHRRNSLPEPVKDRPSRGFEHIFMFVKSRYYFFNRDGLPQGGDTEDVWSIPVRAGSNGAPDTAPFPEELVDRCLLVGCPPGGTALDPFCGSGTNLRVALRSNRSATGVELNATFCEYALRSLPTIVSA